MNDTQPSPNPEQTTLWNGPSGRAWADTQDVVEQMLQPFEDLLIQSISPGAASRVLDVGCGTGSTTVAMARRLGASGQCTGIDISEPMLVVARARVAHESTPPNFILGDAETHLFEPSSFDVIVSRFGVMFFSNPVRAFTNLRKAAVPGAALSCAVWRGMAENEFMTVAERVAAPLIPNLPVRRPDEPGQFAFADRSRVQRILLESGWSQIDIQPVDIPCAFLEKDLVRYVTHFGPVGRVLHQTDDRTREQFIEAVRAALDPYVHDGQVRFTSACWLVCGCA